MCMITDATIETVRGLNEDITALNDNGELVTVAVNQKPQLKVMSFQPMSYERYGRIFNRASHVVGRLTMRAVLEHADDSVAFYTALEARASGYGFQMEGLEALNELAFTLRHEMYNHSLTPNET